MAEHDPAQPDTAATAEQPARQAEPSASAWLALPGARAGGLCLLGPDPDRARSEVELLRPLEEPLTVVQAVVGGLCDAAGELAQPVELLRVCPPEQVGPDRQIPRSAVLATLAELPAWWQRMGAQTGPDVGVRLFASATPVGPLLYCRKRHRVFEAYAPDWPALPELPPSCAELIPRQQEALAQAERLAAGDAAAAARLRDAHPCIDCPERARCFPAGGGYAFFADRLVVLSAGRGPLPIAPLGAWTLAQAAAIVGGAEPGGFRADPPADPFDAWCADRAAEFERCGPPRLLAGERDGRELLEIARLKLTLIAETLAQLDAFWRIAGRPHLGWTAQTVRVAWRRPGTAPAACWGFVPILRKCGLHPLSPLESIDGRPLPYPPALSHENYLASATRDAARYFDEPRPAAMFVKKEVAGDGEGMTVLLEGLGIPWELLAPCDTVAVRGDGWQALLRPLPARDLDDGEGLPFSGTATGDAGLFKQGASFEGVEVRWRPRFGQAVDLHAVGALLLETLLGHDERHGGELHATLEQELAELGGACAKLPPEQREHHAQEWIAQRAAHDAPASLWTPRNLLYGRDARQAARLDALPPTLWQTILLTGLRMTTTLAGLSYCPDRGADVPRVASGEPLPLAELRGLIALLDDRLFGRSAPAEQVRASLGAGPGR